MSGILTIRPNGVLGQTGWVIGGGGTTLNGNVSDNSDTTYITDTTGGNAYASCYVDFSFSTATVPSGAVIKKITPKVRASQASGNVKLEVATNKDFVSGWGADRHGYTVPVTQITPTATISTFTLGAGGKFIYASENYGFLIVRPQTLVDDISLRILSKAASNAADDHRVYDVWLEVEYEEAPKATGLAFSPPDAAARTLTPTLTWSYADPEGSAQQGYRVAVWYAADTLDAKFKPFGDGTASGFYDNPNLYTNSAGVKVNPVQVLYAESSAVTQQRLDQLNNNTDFKAYVQVYDQFGNGPDRANVYSYPDSGAFSFTTAVPIPPAPPAGGLAATYEASKYRVKLDLAASINMMSKAISDMESAANGAWAFTNASGAMDTTAANVVQGSQSWKISATAAGAVNANIPSAERVSIEAGQSYTGYAAIDRSGAYNVDVGIMFVNSSGAQVGSTVWNTWYSADAGAMTNGFQAVAVRATAPAGAVTAGLSYRYTAAAAGDAVWVDTQAISPTLTNQNLVHNGSFESGSAAPGQMWTNYSAGSTGTVTRSFQPVNPGVYGFGSGSRALRLQASALGATSADRVGTSQVVPATAGTAYSAGFSLGIFSNPQPIRLRTWIDWLDAANTVLGSVSGSTAVVANGYAYQSAKVENQVSPAGTVKARVYAWIEGNGGAAGAFDGYIDQVQFVAGTTVQSTYSDLNWSPGGLAGTQVAIVERSSDGGYTWVPIPAMKLDNNGELVGVALTNSTYQRATAYDTVVFPDKTPMYRFRTRSYDSGLAYYIYSDWAQRVSVSTPGTGKWAFRSWSDPDLYVEVPLSMGDLVSTTDEVQGVFRGLGRSTPIVVSDVITSPQFPLRATFRNAFDAATFVSLRNAMDTFLVIGDMDGWPAWCRFLGSNEKTQHNNQGRKATATRAESMSFTIVQVDGPPGQPTLLV